MKPWNRPQDRRRLPRSPLPRHWGHIDDGGTRERAELVSHDPTRVRSDIAMRCPRQIHHAVQQQESRSFFILLGIEGRVTVVCPRRCPGYCAVTLTAATTFLPVASPTL